MIHTNILLTSELPVATVWSSGQWKGKAREINLLAYFLIIIFCCFFFSFLLLPVLLLVLVIPFLLLLRRGGVRSGCGRRSLSHLFSHVVAY